MKETVTDIIEKVRQDICDNYCKWPEKYGVDGDESDPERVEQMMEEICDKCLLDRL